MKNCALNLINEIILYYDARSKKHQINRSYIYTAIRAYVVGICVFLCVVSVPDILSAIIYDS